MCRKSAASDCLPRSCIELFVKNADGELRVWLWGVEESWDVLAK